MLNAAELGHYREAGFVVPDFRLPAETIEAIRRDHDRLIAAHPEFADYCPTVLAYDPGFLNYARIPAQFGVINPDEQPKWGLATE